MNSVWFPNKIPLLFGMMLFVSFFISVSNSYGQDVLAKAAYMNTSYCIGIVETYGERLRSAGGSKHRSTAKQARRYAENLRGSADRLRARYDYSQSDGEAATANGIRTLSGLLPLSGAWTAGGDVPIEAYRQYQNCVTLAE